MLLRRGLDVHRRDRNDNATALHWAAYGGRVDVAKRLLAAGADIDGEGDEHAVGVLGWATCFQHVHTDVADFLLARGAKPTIFAAVALGRADLVDKLVAADRSVLHARMSRAKFRQRREQRVNRALVDTQRKLSPLKTFELGESLFYFIAKVEEALGVIL